MRGVNELTKEEATWRKLKCREILNISAAGPYIYTMDNSLPFNYIRLDIFKEYVVSILGLSIYVLYHREGMYRVKNWAFNRYVGKGICYCTMFDDTFRWFAFTDDNCIENSVVKIFYRDNSTSLSGD